jgi:hypothetical protein
MIRVLFAGVVLSAGVTLFSIQPAAALCLTTSGENNCSTFYGGSVSQVIQTYTSSNLVSNRYFQLGFRSSDGNAYSINNLAYSTNGTSYNSFGGSFTTSSSFQYSSPQNPFGLTALGAPFYVRYDILPIVPPGVNIDSMFLASNTGSTTGGVLDFNGGNFEAIERSHASVPAPLPFLGAAAIFSRLKRLERVSKRLR